MFFFFLGLVATFAEVQGIINPKPILKTFKGFPLGPKDGYRNAGTSVGFFGFRFHLVPNYYLNHNPIPILTSEDNV